MKSIKQKCVWAITGLPFVKESGWKCTNKGIVITYDILRLGNRDVTVPFTKFGNGFFLESMGSLYV